MEGMTMKKVTIFCLLFTSLTFGAQAPGQTPQDARPVIRRGQSGLDHRQVITGKVIRVGTKFVLYDKINKASYQLDDQMGAQPFEGTEVEVIGIIDTATRTIEVVGFDPTH
jgi:hypothetical protein